MAQKLRLGVIGASDGNGHPYSWSSIFNGYNPVYMKKCPFPAIPEYLSKQKFPRDGLGHLGSVTHIWSQDLNISKHIAAAANIEHIVKKKEEMIAHVDAILLARDDAENHFRMAMPFLKKGLPVFIDKPLALSTSEAKNIFSKETHQNQVFSCSALRYASELILSEEEKRSLGKVHHVEGSVMKKWDTYAVHLIEPLVSQLPLRGKLIRVVSMKKNGIHCVLIEWRNVSAYLKVTGEVQTPLELKFFGQNQHIKKTFSDSFSCFKKSLEMFIKVSTGEEKNISKKETYEIIEIIERGRSK